MGALLFMFIIIAVVLLVYSMNQKKRKPFLSSNTSGFIIAGYIVILILSVFVLCALPEKNTVKSVKDNQLPQESVESMRDNFSSVAKGGIDKLDNFGGIYKNGSFSFSSKGNQLEIVNTDDSSFYNIWVERKSEDDGKIEAFSYITHSVVYDVDITKRILPPEMKFKDNRLLISRGKKNVINFAGFDNDFTAAQFTKDGFHIKSYSHYMSFGTEAVYLHIPKSMQIVDSKLEINYAES